jgi:hypothetical protein
MREYYVTSIDVKEQKKLIDEVTDFVFENGDKDAVRKTIDHLVGLLIGGFNAYKSVDEYLDSSKDLKTWWEKGREEVFSSNNAGWSMCVIETLRIMAEELNDRE